jgi:enoyl-CoA hydratase/carnithine racemase
MSEIEPNSPTVEYSFDGTVAELRLHSPRRRNALSRALVRAGLDALERSREDRARAILVTSTGRVFSAGANVDDLKGGWLDGSDHETDPTFLFRALVDEPRPVIAAVQGPAVGGGFELTLCCDFVLAADTAFFQLPELGLGVIPNTAAARLAQIVGLRQALHIVMTRRRVPAPEALGLGLVNEILPVSQVVSRARALAGLIVGSGSPGAISVAKRAMHHHSEVDWTYVMSSLKSVPKDEWKEGISAFLQHRQPDYDRFW